MFILYLVLIVILAVLALPKVKGILGETELRLLLRRLDPNTYKAIHDVMLPNNGKTTQIDHVVVSPFGIFVIETKNYKGWIFGSERSQTWTQVIYKRKEKFYNPIHQNFGHIKALESLLGDEYQGPFFSIISFSTRSKLKKIDLQSSNVDVIYSSQVNNRIKSRNQAVIPSEKINELASKIANASMSSDKQAKKAHVKAIRTTKKEQMTKVKANICPKCGGTLVRRKTIRKINDEEIITAMHEMYMNVGRIGKGVEYVGIDWLRWWYQRNLIIYSNLANLISSHDDRILLLIGGSHIYLVAQFLKESGLAGVEPAYNYLS